MLPQASQEPSHGIAPPREIEPGDGIRGRIPPMGNAGTSHLARRTAHCLLLLFLALPLTAEDDPLSAGDAAWARRAEGRKGARAAAGPIDQAIAAYQKATAARPAELPAYWKLLRAIHFKGEFVASTPQAKQEVFGRGREVSEAALDQLGKHVGGRKKLDAMEPAAAAKALAGVPDAAPIFLWAGVDWGLWGDAFGKLAAARQGVGDRTRRYGEVVLAIDERFDEAGGHRLLGRLHTLAPKIPFVTGWVSRDEAVSHLRRAVELAPRNPYNHLYLADALLQYQPAKKAEALQILRRVAAHQPDPERVVEQSQPVAEAKALLAKHGS